MGLMLCPPPQLGPAACFLVQDVSIMVTRGRLVTDSVHVPDSSGLAGWKTVTPWKCERGVGGRWAQRAEEVGGALRRGGGLRVPLGCSVAPLLIPSLRSCLLQIQKV